MRLLFLAIPAEGHIRPLLPLAEAALASGHDVMFATGPDAIGAIKTPGITKVPAGLSMAEARSERTKRFGGPARSVGREGWRNGQRMFAQVCAPPMVEDLLSMADIGSPDVIIYEVAALAGVVLGRLLGVPVAAHGYGVLRPVAALDAFDTSAEELWTQYGLAATKWVGLADGTYLDVCPPSLQASHVDRLPRVLRIRTADAPEGARQVSRPMVYVTFGTVFGERSVFETVLAGLRTLDVDVIATVGHGIDPAELGHQPQHIRIERFIPQREILDRASVVICHAGSGTLLGSLAAGVPTVMIPQGADQYWNADACSAAGAGTVVDLDEVSTQGIADAVTSLLNDPRYSERAQILGGEIAAMPSPTECLQILLAGTLN